MYFFRHCLIFWSTNVSVRFKPRFPVLQSFVDEGVKGDKHYPALYVILNQIKGENRVHGKNESDNGRTSTEALGKVGQSSFD